MILIFCWQTNIFCFFFLFERGKRSREEERRRGGVGGVEGVGEERWEGKGEGVRGMVDGCERDSCSPLLFALSSHLIHWSDLLISLLPSLHHPKHKRTQLNNKRTCYHNTTKEYSSFHLLSPPLFTSFHLLSPPFFSFLPLLPLSSSFSCPLLSDVVHVGIYWRYG